MNLYLYSFLNKTRALEHFHVLSGTERGFEAVRYLPIPLAVFPTLGLRVVPIGSEASPIEVPQRVPVALF
jgi:hypothetical protein